MTTLHTIFEEEEYTELQEQSTPSPFPTESFRAGKSHFPPHAVHPCSLLESMHQHPEVTQQMMGSLSLPSKIVGCVIGRRGIVHQRIQIATGTKIIFAPQQGSERLVSIYGSATAVKQAQALIMQRVTRQYAAQTGNIATFPPDKKEMRFASLRPGWRSNEEVPEIAHMLPVLKALHSCLFVSIAADQRNTISAAPWGNNDRLMHRLQEAHWLYLDRYVTHSSGKLPNLGFTMFVDLMSRVPGAASHIPREKLKQRAAAFLARRSSAPSIGTVLLDASLRRCVLVQSVKSDGSSESVSLYTFPRGKAENGETDLECAVRETHEETGLDVAELIDPSQYVCIGRPSGRYLKLFVVPGIATSVALRPRSVREIHTAEWFDLCDLEALATMDAPAARGFRSVAAILPKLQAWIYHYHMAQANTYGGRRSLSVPIPMMPMRRSRIGVGNGYRYTECDSAYEDGGRHWAGRQPEPHCERHCGARSDTSDTRSATALPPSSPESKACSSLDPSNSRLALDRSSKEAGYSKGNHSCHYSSSHAPQSDESPASLSSIGLDVKETGYQAASSQVDSQQSIGAYTFANGESKSSCRLQHTMGVDKSGTAALGDMDYEDPILSSLPECLQGVWTAAEWMGESPTAALAETKE